MGQLIVTIPIESQSDEAAVEDLAHHLSKWLDDHGFIANEIKYLE